MRYTKYHTIITKTADNDLVSLEEICQLLVLLKEKELAFQLKLNDCSKFFFAKILDIDKEQSRFKFQMFSNTSSVIRWTTFSNIDAIEVNHFDGDISTNKNISRWMILEPTNA